MKIKVKSYRMPEHRVRSHRVSGYMRKVVGENRRIKIKGHVRKSHIISAHIVPFHVRTRL